MADECPSPAPTWQLPPDFPLEQFDGDLDAAERRDVSDADHALAFENIRLAASYFHVHMTEKAWHDLRPYAAAIDATAARLLTGLTILPVVET